MITINDLQRMALELNAVNKALEKVSHYKVNQKIYELMKTIDNGGIVYHARLDALLLNGKPVFIDNDMEDGIATYQRKESEDNKPINFYNANIMTVRPRPIEPIAFIDVI